MYESPAPAPPPPETNGVVGSQSQIHERECPMFISPAPGTRPPAGEGECTASSKNWKAEMEKARLKGPFTPRKQLNVTGALSKGDGRRKEPTGPPRSDVFKPKLPCKSTMFRQFYDNGGLPVTMDGCRNGELIWTNGADKLDHCLPLFFDGLRETQEPYASLAMRGCLDLMDKFGDRVLDVVPQLIMPIKLAMDTNVPMIMCRTLICIQTLVKCHSRIGTDLVPYYRQIMPACARFKNKNVNCGDRIDYSQYKRQNVGDLIEETLQLLERYGGEDAFINIKYMIPTYESCMLNERL